MTNPDSYAVPATGVTVSSGDLQIGSMEVPIADPFNGDCVELQVTKPVDLDQLATAIQRRTKTFPQLAMRQNPGDQPASREQPYVLWIHPGSLNPTICQQLLDKHTPIAQQVDAEPIESSTPPVTAVSPDLSKSQQQSVAKLQSGDDLSAAESSDLLRAILGISS